MSAPHIPNLNSLRSSRQATSSRGRGRGLGGAGHADSDHVDDPSAKDRIVQHTDQDASVSRMSAVELGYLDDRFAKDLAVEAAQRRFPIINRGTFVRTTAIDELVGKFLRSKPSEKKQIISLGAGSDTRFFRLVTGTKRCPMVYHELDFASNTAQKIASIKRSPTLMTTIEKYQLGDEPNTVTVSGDGSSLYSSTYNLHAIDLRTLPSRGESSLPNVDTSLPTLLVSECCLIYLPPSDADSILKDFTSTLFPVNTPLGIIVYEPINPDDAFGRVMVQNLATRGIVLQTLKKYGSLDRQKARLKMLGFSTKQEAADVEFAWERWITAEEKGRISRLEMVDEVEEWRMLAQHYCIAYGWRDGASEDGGENDDAFAQWHDVVGSSMEEWKALETANR